MWKVMNDDDDNDDDDDIYKLYQIFLIWICHYRRFIIFIYKYIYTYILQNFKVQITRDN